MERENFCVDTEKKTEFKKLREELFCELGLDEKKYKDFCKLRSEKTPFPQELTFQYYSECTSNYNNLTWEWICDLAINKIPSSYVNNCVLSWEQIKFDIIYLSAQNIIDLYKCGFNPKVDWPMLEPYMCNNVEWCKTFEVVSYPYKKTLISFLDENKYRSLQLWNEKIPLSHINYNWIGIKYHFNIITWLIQTAKTLWWNMNKIPWEIVFENFQSNINEYIEVGRKKVDKVFFIWTNDDVAFYSRSSMQTIFWSFSWSEPMTSYLENSWIEKWNIITSIETYIEKNPNKKVVLYMWLHGSKDGFTMFDGRFFSKEEFEKLRHLSLKYNFTIFLDGCYLWNKYLDPNDKSWKIISTTNNEKWIGFNIEPLIEIYKKQGNKLSFEEFIMTYYLTWESGAINIKFYDNKKQMQFS